MRQMLALFASVIFTLSVSAQNKYTIQQYLNIKSASSPSFSADGRRLIYLTNASGTSQIWAIDLPNGAPRQLTKYDDNISFAKYTPNGEIVFGKAVGGNENTQFYVMKSDGASVRALTDTPKVRNNFGEISDDGKLVYYTSNERNPNYFDVYALQIADGKQIFVHNQDGNNDIAAASEDGKRIIVSRSGTELGLDNDLYLIDVPTGKETLLTPHKGAAQYSDVLFVSNNEINLATNENREFMTFATMFLDQKFIQMPDNSPEPQWDLETLEMSPTKDAQARVINREGFSELEIYRRQTKGKSPSKETVKLPAQGIVGGLSFLRRRQKTGVFIRQREIQFGCLALRFSVETIDANHEKFAFGYSAGIIRRAAVD